MGSEHLGDSKHILPMRYGVEDVFSDPFPKDQNPFLVTRRTEVASFAGESEKDLVITTLTLYPGKAFP